MNIMIETEVDVQIVRRTSYTHKRTEDTDPFENGGTVTGHADDVYDFGNEDHRRDLFAIMVREYHTAEKWHGNMEKLIEELREAVKEYEDELPFR